MPDYDDRAELAPRDIVSRSINTELMRTGDECVYLDCTHINIKDFKAHFPNIYDKCISNLIDIEKDWIPVIPVSHYLCGGIEVDTDGKTSVKNLYACGECARTGLHGANRLASNSLLEALVYAHHIYEYLILNVNPSLHITLPEWNDTGVRIYNEQNTIEPIVKELQILTRDYAGIVRSNDRLLKATGKLDVIYTKVENLYKTSKINTRLCELRNMVNVAHLIIGQSIDRKENKGGYFNVDNQI